MPARSDFSLVGFEDIKNRLSKLTANVRDKAGRTALRKAAGIVAKAARDGAIAIDDPETGRRIRDNIRLQFATRFFRETGNIMYRVGVATKRGRIPDGNPDEGPLGNTPHWHLVELGTEHSRAFPFMRPALANNINAVIDKTATELENELDKLSP